MEEQKKNPAQGLSESEQVQVRRQKLADLQAAGRDPFTLTKFPQDAYSADLKEEFKDLPNETDSGKKVALAGRLMSKRVMGKASFAHLRDDKGDIQLYVRRDELGDDAYAAFIFGMRMPIRMPSYRHGIREQRVELLWRMSFLAEYRRAANCQ